MGKNILWALLSAILIGCHPPQNHKIEKITIGVVSYGEGTESLDRYEPLKDYLATQTNAIVELEPAYNELKALEQIKQQNWSLVFVPPGLSAIAIKRQLYTPLFPSEGINRLEKSVLVVLKNSPLEDIRDLSNRTIALGKTGSATGYYLPLYDLYGLTLQEIKLAPTPKQVLKWLQEGTVVAGALSEKEFELYRRQFKAEFRILHKSRTIPPAMVMLASNLPKNRQTRISELLKNAPSSSIENIGYAPNIPIPDYQQFIILIAKVKPLEKKVRQIPATLTF